MALTGATRAPATLLGAGAAGVLLWLAGAHVDRHTTGGYWAAYGLVAAAGLAFGLSQLRGGGGHPPLVLLLAFLPVLVAGGWILIALQPHAAWGALRVRSWSSDVGILDVVRAVGTWLGVVAFGIGATFAAVLEPFTRRRVVVEPPVDAAAADEPVAAERREVETRETVVR